MNIDSSRKNRNQALFFIRVVTDWRPELPCKTACALTNIAPETSNQTKFVMKAWDVHYFIKLVSTSNTLYVRRLSGR